MITKDELLKKYNIEADLFRSAQMSWEDLCAIYEDFSEKKDNKYKKIMDDFVSEYLKDIIHQEINGNPVKIHSYRYRVKDPEHLIVKIIRKKQEKFAKYEKLDKNNYEKFVTDLIGIRCFVLFKEDWMSFHHYIMSKFENKVEYYIDQEPLKKFDEDSNHYYFAEKPKAHIRNGDAKEIYEKLLPPECVIDDKIYRSVHYIIKYQGVYLEIQVRTLFEEGWGEVDHAIVYPYYQKDPVLKEYTELLNRLSGLADEMGSFFYRLREIEKTNLEHTSTIRSSTDIEEVGEVLVTEQEEIVTNEITNMVADTEKTPYTYLKTVIEE